MFATVIEGIRTKDNLGDPFYEVACNKPKHLYNPYQDVLVGDFVLVHPLDIHT